VLIVLRYDHDLKLGDIAEKVWAIPTTTHPEPHWLPRLDTRRFQSMFSATKFVVVGVIVALFAGFLLGGVLTQQPSEETVPAVGASASASARPDPTVEATDEAVPTTDPTSEPEPPADLLPGVDLVTEEVQPGVYRVLSDGIRDLTNVVAAGGPDLVDVLVPGARAASDERSAFWDFLLSPDIAAGRASVWWFGPGGFFRLGDDQTHDWDERDSYPGIEKDIEIAPDGTLWVADRGLRTFDGASWADVQPRSVSVEIEEDGTVWSAWEPPNGKHGFVGRLIDGVWQRLEGQLPTQEACRYGKGGSSTCGSNFFGGLSVSDDGSPWVITGVPSALFRHVGEGWRRLDTPRGELVWGAVAPDGTRWVQLQRKDNLVLARHEGDGWTVHDTLSPRRNYRGIPPYLRVAPDGGLWVTQVEGPNGPGDCRGVARFDEGGPRHFLGDLCVYAMDVAPDGKVWLQAGEVRDVGSMDLSSESLGPAHTYVITPEAVAATE
jgi:hypothetical protein